MSSPSAARVGLEVRGVMIDQGKTQRDVGAVLGLSQQAASRRLRGTIPFDVVELTKLAEYFGVPIAQFFPTVAA